MTWFTLRTPRSVALASALLIGVLLGLAYSASVLVLNQSFELIWLILTVALGFLFSYGIIYFFIEKFLYHKVKIIYRTIHTLKSQGDSKHKIQMSSDVLNEINTQVADWADEKIKEVKQLRTVENYRKEFIGNLAHELKTPIFNIQGYIDTLLESDLDDPELTRRFLSKASNSCDRLSDLVLDLDQMASLESGEMPLDLQRFDIVELARNTVDLLEGSARQRNISLKLRNPNERAIHVEADPKKVQQVLTNLMVNSINYGRENGETKIHFFDMGDNILIEVSDDGMGMSVEHLPRIFERFYRVDKSRSRNEGGSGLGLAICKHIIDLHNQSISVRSTEGVGSTFGFTLKRA